MTAALVAFLKARLDMDAEIAAGAPRGPWRNAPTARHHATASGRSEEAVFGQDGLRVATTGEPADRRNLVAAEYIARHDPARTLREVEAKRMIVDAHGRDHECISLTGSGDTNAVDGKPWALWELEHTADAETPCFVLRALVLPYADHPDYLPEWRP